ncbi:MATE family efflux transporter [Halococcus saccharolyticus]|uniref:MATE family drug/sodium antiporter n=1 Tax=Halococcus saccharolyticus DSM 5350 TaxID=1227455 RepID=M0MK64_9EURY|nr:MATE family efflux transporter [Halococcus saccharolyticus]EMA45778.1 MATE family drug/sodium antiporter [Halococcus saccharolyticus DSM 5350]
MRIRERLASVFKSKEEFDLTSGGIAKPLFYLSLPLVITNLLQTAYNLADTFWLGQYSTDALAAISFAFPMVFFLISLALGLSVAGSVLVAQHTGAGNEERAAYAASQTVSIAIIGSIVLGVLSYPFVDEFVRLLGASPAVAVLVTEYMRVYALGLVFVFGFFMFVSLMRGYGDTITPMLVMAGTVVLNVAIDPILILGWGPVPELGVEGAAIATVFSRAVAFVVGFVIMVRGSRGVTINLRDMVPDPAFARTLFRIGVPASIEGTGRAISINLMLVIIATFSTSVVAAYGIGTRVFSVVFLPAIALSQGVETMTGQNVGAGKPDRAAQTNRLAARAMFVGLTVLGIVSWIAADPIVAVFTSDAAVIDIGARFLRYVAPTFGFIGIMYAYTGGFRGTGQTTVAAAISILMLGVIRVPFAWLVAGPLGPPGVWLSFGISNVAGAVIAYLWFRRGGWRSADLTEQHGRTGAPDTAVDD